MLQPCVWLQMGLRGNGWLLMLSGVFIGTQQRCSNLLFSPLQVTSTCQSLTYQTSSLWRNGELDFNYPTSCWIQWNPLEVLIKQPPCKHRIVMSVDRIPSNEEQREWFLGRVNLSQYFVWHHFCNRFVNSRQNGYFRVWCTFCVQNEFLLETQWLMEIPLTASSFFHMFVFSWTVEC